MFGFVKRRAKPGVPSEDVLRSAVWKKTDGYCYLCGLNLRGVVWHVDHLWSVARNGPDHINNFMPACPKCNEAKGPNCVLPTEGTLYRARKATYELSMWLWHSAHCGEDEFVIPGQPILGPHVATLRVFPPAGYHGKMLGMHHDIRAALNQRDAAVRLMGRELWVSVPRKVWRDVPLKDMAAGHGWMDLGLSELNERVRWAWKDAPHLLVAGRTGSGKSETLRTLVAQAIRIGAQLILIDADGTTFDPFLQSASLLCAVAKDKAAAGRAIRYAHAIMEERPIDPDHSPPIILAIDEMQILSESDKAVLHDFVARARRRNMHGLFATHRPVAAVITPGMKDNCPVRIALQVGDGLASRLIIDSNGAERLQGKGDALMVGAAGAGGIVRLRVAYGPDAFLARLPQGSPAPPAPDIGTPEAVDPRYTRKDTTEMVAFLVERYMREGLEPSVPPIREVFGGNEAALRRARDEACRQLGVPTPAEKRDGRAGGRVGPHTNSGSPDKAASRSDGLIQFPAAAAGGAG